MPPSSVPDLLSADRWDLVEATGPSGPATLRYRVPILNREEIGEYIGCLRVVWTYADEGSGALPGAAVSSSLGIFENRLCEALERDALAVLTAVLTLDGARQWVFYTANVKACGARINEMPQNAEAYPIELDSFVDDQWDYLREQILAPLRAA